MTSCKKGIGGKKRETLGIKRNKKRETKQN